MSRAKQDPAKQGWEESEFPILCETCLGDNPYVRMTKQSYGKECKICSRPFTIFRWNPGAGMRFKKTEICQSCSKMKNVCQTCILDLQYGLPVQVRDTALEITDTAPRSEVNREFYVQNMENQLEGNTQSLIDYSKAPSAGKEILKKLARNEPYYKRNRAHICSFYVKGQCKRGDECPYRHELPEENGLENQNIKDRYFGSNDPVAKRMLNRIRGGGELKAPEDKSITSLFITGVEEDITEQDLRGWFYAFGEIKSCVVVHKSKCAFVNFTTRQAAEAAAEKAAATGVTLKGTLLRVNWARPKPQGPRLEVQAAASSANAILGVPPPPPGSAEAASFKYPSQDPTFQGSNTN